MTVQLKALFSAILPTTVGALYTAPSNKSARIMAATLWNDSSSLEQFSLWRVPALGAPNTAGKLAGNDTAPASDNLTVEQLIDLVLEPGWSLWGEASTANVLSLNGSGFEQTVS